MKQTSTLKAPIITLMSLWALSLLVLWLCQKLHLDIGLKIWPLDEDRNWINFMHSYPGKNMMHGFWQMNDRNPLSPWWWYAVKNLVMRSNYWLYGIRKCIDPFLAITTFLLLDRLGRQRNRTFAFSCAVLVLIWNFNAYHNQIIWNFLGALGFNLLAIFFYCRYIDNKRLAGHDLAFAMLCYFIAIATYTLQAGGVVAIAFLAFFRDTDSKSFIQRCWTAARDTGFFVAIFLIFNAIWFTTSRNTDTYYVMHWDLFFQQISLSLQQFFYHTSYTALMADVRLDWSNTTIAAILLATFSIFVWLLAKYPGKKILDNSTSFPIIATFFILAAISLPAILVEATNTTWYPGSRSLMVQQVWQPILYTSLIFLSVNLIPKLSQKLRHSIAIILVSALAAVIFLVSLNYNHHLFVRTRYQMKLADGIHRLHISRNTNFVLVKLTDPKNKDLNGFSVLIASYINSALPEDYLNVRVLADKPKPEFADYWTVEFNNDAAGVVNAGPIADNAAKPYDKVMIVFFDGKHVWMPKEIKKSDLDGFQIAWNRKNSIDQSKK